MYCRLAEDYALRAWKYVDHDLYHRYTADPLRVDDRTYDLLTQCGTCEWFGHCGGCRALRILDAGERTGAYDYAASDPLACLFFKGGWYEKVQERLKPYRRLC